MQNDSKLNIFNCIKCGEQYTSEDVEAYYCQSCIEIKNKIAKEVDNKFSKIQRTPRSSDLQLFDELRKKHGTNFINAREIGINFN